MENVLFDVPSMYGDHHVVEVRRILLEIPGVESVDASSAFHMVEVSFDPEKVNADQLKIKLEEAGYLGEMPVPVETSTAATETNGSNKPFFRHTAAYEHTRQVVSFAQSVPYNGRPLWPCPGMGTITVAQQEN